MNALSLNAQASSIDAWARRGAWAAVLSTAAALLWIGFTLFRPVPAPPPAPGLQVPTVVADAPSARSTR